MSEEKQEIWKPVFGYETIYMISNSGRIKSLPKKPGTGIEFKYHKEYIHKIWKGDIYITFFAKGKHKGIARTMLETFKPVPNMNNLYANHINGNKHDNKLENLEWVTPKENITHAWKTGLNDKRRGEYIWTNKLKESEVKQIREEYKNCLNKRKFVTEAVKKYNVGRHNIYHIIKKISWRHIQ